MKNNKLVYALLGVIVVLLIIIGFLVVEVTKGKDKGKEETEKKNDVVEKEENKVEAEPVVNDFHFTESGSQYGTATVKGYITEKEIIAGDISFDASNTYTALFFNVTETESTEFKNFLKAGNGNSFHDEKGFVIGCYEDGVINYYNSSDETGMKAYKIPEADALKIKNSTIEAPVTLEVSVLKLSSGMGAPDCYSFISTVKVK